jgi:hypothetical protein
MTPSESAQSKAKTEPRTLSEEEELDSVLSHVWVMAGDRITLKEQHWIANTLIPFLEKYKKHKASEKAKKREAIKILEAIKFESGLYARNPHCETDEKYCRRVYDLATKAKAELGNAASETVGEESE